MNYAAVLPAQPTNVDAGQVEVLEPQRWASHLEPLQLTTVSQQPGHPVVPGHAPRYVIDRSPYGDPHYRPPVLDLGGGS